MALGSHVLNNAVNEFHLYQTWITIHNDTNDYNKHLEYLPAKAANEIQDYSFIFKPDELFFV